MKTIQSISAALAAISFILSACGGSPATPQAAAPQVDSAATKTAMAKEEAMKKDEMAKADATKTAMAKEDAMKKDEMANADATKTAMAKEEAMKKGDAMVLAKGEFTKVDASHFANGQASIDKAADGKLVLRFSNFKAAPGPDLYVVLSGHPQPATSGEVMGSGDLDLGKLQNVSGDQEYALPAGFDATQFKSVVIYCKQFSFVFSTATLAQ
jgi:hypothetical protein